jgi:hypothetical protein
MSKKTPRKSKRRKQQDKIAQDMEKLLLRGTFQQELKDLHFEDIKLNGRILEALADKECMATMIGISLGLPANEVTLMIHQHEEELSYNRRTAVNMPQLLRAYTTPDR